jgi:hypothetical protein
LQFGRDVRATMSETKSPSQQPGKEDGKKKQGSPQEGDERPPEENAPSDGGSTDAVPRRSQRLGPLGRLDICED